MKLGKNEFRYEKCSVCGEMFDEGSYVECDGEKAFVCNKHFRELAIEQIGYIRKKLEAAEIEIKELRERAETAEAVAKELDGLCGAASKGLLKQCHKCVELEDVCKRASESLQVAFDDGVNFGTGIALVEAILGELKAAGGSDA